VLGTNSVLTLQGTPKAVAVTVTDDTLTVDLDDGRTIAVPVGWYLRLAYATADERANVQIAGAGYGLHWPELDEDIGAEGLPGCQSLLGLVAPG
jgi:hypothetical protein